MQDLATYRGPDAGYFMGPEPSEVSAIHLEYATRSVLADIDGFCDQLDTFGRSYVESERALRVPGRLLQADDAVVLHALLTATSDANIRACRDELVRRYLEREDERILRLAGQYATECEA